LRANKPSEAAKAYARAVALDTANSGILPISYGQALTATGTPDALQKAVVEIRRGLSRDPEFADGYVHLAQAYGRLGNVAEAELATAEANFYAGDYQQAKIFAARAQTKFKRGAPGWVRAQDIINYKAPKKRR
jgi:predicted Zn-dependent protease